MNQCINVLFTSHYEHTRMGGQQSMIQIIKHLDRSKFNPIALVTKEGELSCALREIKCKTYCFDLPDVRRSFLIQRWKREARYFFETVKKIQGIIKSEQINIIHADEEDDAVSCILAARGTSAKVIFHGRVTAKHKLDRIIARGSHFIVGVSHSILKRFNDFRVANKYQTIYDGADLKRFTPLEDRSIMREKLRLSNDRFILLFVGQLKIGKGVLDLVEAMAILKTEFNEEHMPKLIMAGVAIEPSFYKLLVEKIQSLQLSHFITLVGQQENIHEWMQCADTLLLPSHEGVEGLGRVLFEAMLCGAIGITTNISGTNEVVSDEIGILVPEHSPSALASAIMNLMNNPSMKARLKEKSVLSARDRFDINVHCRVIEKIYARLC